jgi:hypothetical protein
MPGKPERKRAWIRYCLAGTRGLLRLCGERVPALLCPRPLRRMRRSLSLPYMSFHYVCRGSPQAPPPFVSLFLFHVTRRLFAPYPLFMDSGEKTPLSGRYACFRNASRRASMGGRITIRPYRRARPLSIALLTGLRFEVASEQNGGGCCLCKPFLGGLPGITTPGASRHPLLGRGLCTA